eukprot:613782-Pyramimonas_sp.AAC.1
MVTIGLRYPNAPPSSSFGSTRIHRGGTGPAPRGETRVTVQLDGNLDRAIKRRNVHEPVDGCVQTCLSKVVIHFRQHVHNLGVTCWVGGRHAQRITKMVFVMV